ncbi:MAG: hypothetical protein ABJF01_12670 [bacterium]
MHRTVRFRRLTTSVVILGALAGCGGRSPGSGAVAGHVDVRTPHFAIAADGIDSAAVRALGVSLESNRQRVADDLQASSLGITRVVIQSKDAFDKQWSALIGGSGIGFQVQGLTGADGAIYIYGPWAAQHSGSPLQQVALHELAHAATQRSAVDYVASSGRDTIAYIAAMPALGVRVRWLSEMIAVYEARQSTDLNRFWYLIRGRYPSIADLNDPTKSQVYEVGYRVAEFIRAQWGPDALARLVHADGDVRAALGVSEAELMRRWFLHVEDRYLLIKPRWFTTRR